MKMKFIFNGFDVDFPNLSSESIASRKKAKPDLHVLRIIAFFLIMSPIALWAAANGSLSQER